MLSIKRLSKKFGRQSLSEVKPAPSSSTVDHTVPLTSSTTTVTTSIHTSNTKNDLTLESDKTPLDKPCLPSSQVHPSCDHSDSSDSESEEEGGCSRTRAPVHNVIRRKHLTNNIKIERVSSAEKRKYRQYKYSTGSSSSASSSDDEIKEAFEGHTHQRQSFLPLTSQTFSWTSLKDSKQGYPHPWSTESTCSNRPLKVVPAGHRKPKFFAQMSGNFSERPRLDFNKMQHSKRLVVVRRPLVLRNNSKVHSIQRPPSLEVSLDISDHSFQPVLTQS